MNEQPPPVSAAKTSALAITSLVLGSISMVPCFGFITVVPSLVMGGIALRKIRKSDGALKGKGIAIGGLCTGGVGLIVAALMVAWTMWLWRTVSNPRPPESPTTIAINEFCQALELYSIDNGVYPTTAEGLQALVTRPTDHAKWDGPYVEDGKIKDDAWGHPYVYRCPGVKVPAGFDLFSVGPDGKEGTADDIGNW